MKVRVNTILARLARPAISWPGSDGSFFITKAHRISEPTYMHAEYLPPSLPTSSRTRNDCPTKQHRREFRSKSQTGPIRLGRKIRYVPFHVTLVFKTCYRTTPEITH